MAAGRRFYSSEEATALILQGLSDNEDYSSDSETSESEEDNTPDNDTSDTENQPPPKRK